MNNEQIRVLALIGAANARVAGMQAANTHREQCGEAIAYGEQAFAVEAAHLEELALQVINT